MAWRRALQQGLKSCWALSKGAAACSAPPVARLHFSARYVLVSLVGHCGLFFRSIAADSVSRLDSGRAAALGPPWPPHARTLRRRAAQPLRQSQRRATEPPSRSAVHSSRVPRRQARRSCGSLRTALSPRPTRRLFLGCGSLRGWGALRGQPGCPRSRCSDCLTSLSWTAQVFGSRPRDNFMGPQPSWCAIPFPNTLLTHQKIAAFKANDVHNAVKAGCGSVR